MNEGEFKKYVKQNCTICDCECKYSYNRYCVRPDICYLDLVTDKNDKCSFYEERDNV